MSINFCLEIIIIISLFFIPKKNRRKIWFANLLFGVLVIFIAPTFADPGFGDMIVGVLGMMILLFSIIGLIKWSKDY
jgi:hypothetical protein